MSKTFRCGSWFFTALDRLLCDKGLIDFIPVNYHECNDMSLLPDRLVRRADIFVTQATPMDKFGYFNFGLTNTDCRAKVFNAGISIVEVNSSLPVCLGGYEECVHISEIDYVIEGDNPPPFDLGEMPLPNAAEQRIAELIVEEIHDGCCLQLGIGSMPNTIGKMLAESDLKALGVQTEMFCDSMVDMHENGIVTNAKKNVDRYKTTYGFAMGRPAMYEYLHMNPALASCYVSYINSPHRIMQNDNIISINNLLEIDLFNQVCSESKGTRQISGSGGQLDWVAGAYASRGGKSFLAFDSTYTDKEGQLVSRIKPMLTPGAIVTVPRHSVHWVVTEYGKVNMKGLAVWERSEALINLAHPDFRDELTKEAAKMGIWTNSNKLFKPGS